MNIKKALIIAVCVAVFVLVFALAYKKIIVINYGQQLPEVWSSDFSNMTFSDIYKKIGPPQENLSGKGFQNWLIYHWWGWQMLEMGLQNCCPPTSKPTDIYYMVHVYGWYEPAYSKRIH
jgi:hypothetical protein